MSAKVPRGSVLTPGAATQRAQLHTLRVAVFISGCFILVGCTAAWLSWNFVQIPIVRFLEFLWRSYLVYWAIFFSVMAVLFLGCSFKVDENSRYRGFGVLWHPAVLMAATMLLVTWETLRQLSFEKAHSASEHESKITLGISLVFGVGFGLYRLREWSPRLYAVVEMVTAVLLSWQFVDKLPSTLYPVQLLGLATSVYIYVRAFDNFKKGWGNAARVITLFPRIRPKIG